MHFDVAVQVCEDCISEETYEDEDDENNENNWRNDYPDEEEFLPEEDNGKREASWHCHMLIL